MENSVSIEYLAGLFDGEGTVTLEKQRRGPFRRPKLSMTSTTRNLLELCHNRWGGCICTQKVKINYKPAWSWSIRDNKAISAMIELLPYIHEPDKYRRMRLVIEQYKRVTNRQGNYSPQQIVAKHSFENEFFHPSSIISTLT